MKKRVMILFICFNLLLISALCGLFFLAETYPYHPGQPLFNLQHASELARLRLTPGNMNKANYALHLAERRLADLAKAGGLVRTETSTIAFDDALNLALERISLVSAADQVELFARVDIVLKQTDTIISDLEVGPQDVGLASLRLKIDTMLTVESSEKLQSVLPGRPPLKIQSESISFLGKTVDHTEFPLTGGHSGLECQGCHANGVYANTPVECSTCHVYELPENLAAVPSAELYPNHFEGECSDCHRIANWVAFSFNHEDVTECSSCHRDDLPQVSRNTEIWSVRASWGTTNLPVINSEPDNHYPGECALCHSDANDWRVIDYDHEDVTECRSCHELEVALDHYSGKCESCHQDTQDWLELQFDHTGYRDCLSCHENSDPIIHYNAQCSNCHNAANWSLADFNHEGYSDCQDCHTKPSLHYSGQCSNCHKKDSWENIHFNHSGLNDCQSCHSSPSYHFSGACTNCHTTRTWQAFSFSHLGLNDCNACHTSAAPAKHYTGLCSNCHTTSNWTNVTFNHTGYTDCVACHAAPSGHYDGQCSDCHSTYKWNDVMFTHVGSIDCQSCHQAPSGHYGGQCSDCHSVYNWNPITFPHVDADNCKICHQAPSGHWPGQCSGCHIVLSWGSIHFDHTNYEDCKSCHSQDKPANHPIGQCSRCHVTDTWIIPTPAPGAPSARPISEAPTSREPVATQLPETP
jgi:hypothetical protein